MNHWKPNGNAFVGDCMPFYRDGVFHLYYLLDLNHHNHPIAGSLGGHQYAHAASRDLIHWEHEPLALRLDFENGECSNCTGSMMEYQGKIFAFYSLRSRLFSGEEFRIAVSSDGGKSFMKWNLPDLKAPPESGGHFRDPKVFEGEDGLIHLLMSSGANDSSGAFPVRTGEIAHYTTSDLVHYQRQEPLLRTCFIPECCDYFQFGSKYYYTYNLAWETFARCSERPFGPWSVPPQEVPASRFCAVMKTAPWHNGRRIGVGWIPSQDKGVFVFGGRTAFRELVQEKDGSLGTKFVEEMIPGERKESFPPLSLNASSGYRAVSLGKFPGSFRLDGRISFAPGTAEFGIHIRDNDQNYLAMANFDPENKHVSWNTMAPVTTIRQVDLKPENVTFRLIRTNDVFDLEINGRRTIAASLFEQSGSLVSLFARDGSAEFFDLQLFE